MALIDTLETYLLDTRQIHALAARQARVLARVLARLFSAGIPEKSREEEARIVLLLNLAALEKGAATADKDFLLQPLTGDAINRYLSILTNEQNSVPPDWAAAMQNPDTLALIGAFLDNLLRDPARLAPISGPFQETDTDEKPLLVVASPRMGFSRYWTAVLRIEKFLRARLTTPLDETAAKPAAEALAPVFGKETILPAGSRFHLRQAAAAALALRSRFLIVSGGPGTGKTTVVTQILRALLRYDDALQPDRIVLCAPTGRAKARLGESVQAGITAIKANPVAANDTTHQRDLALQKVQTLTLHSLLGARPDGSFRYNARFPLPCQVVVVDEASMVDVHLFAGLMDAVSPECRMILLGDMHQLPSVDAGAVLGDLTQVFMKNDGFPTLSPKTDDWINAVVNNVSLDKTEKAAAMQLPAAALPLLTDHAVILTKSNRSIQAIQDVCTLINKGDGEGATASIRNNEGACFTLVQNAGINNCLEKLRRCMQEQYLSDSAKETVKRLNGAAGDEEVLAMLEGFRILCIGHEGRLGRIAVNRMAEAMLRPEYDPDARGRFFHGQQVMLTHNIHELDLYNGDTGIIVRSPANHLQVMFRKGAQGAHFRLVAAYKLAGLEPAFAVTVHKSQGSEYNGIALALPEYDSPRLNRQIIYTAITRAKSKVTILDPSGRLGTAISRRDERPGGVNLGA